MLRPWRWSANQRRLPASSDLQRKTQTCFYLQHLCSCSVWTEKETNTFRSKTHNPPYLSRKRKTKVSTMVMRTPAQRGILLPEHSRNHHKLFKAPDKLNLRAWRQHLPEDSRLNAMAQPITSCMSEPTIATSTISHGMIRGTWTRTGCQLREGGRNTDCVELWWVLVPDFWRFKDLRWVVLIYTT